MGDIAHYWVGKEERAAIAAQHTENMERHYLDEIEDCVKKTKLFSNQIYVKEHPYKKVPITLDNIDTVAAADKYQEGKTVILNFASYKNPGGGFVVGSKAQEECLCHESYLYNILSRKMDYYEWNRKHLNHALYLNRALYTPKVRFNFGKCDVLTCAAPNYTTASKRQNISAETNNKVLKDRIKFILDICEHNKCKTLILGAFGCGVFGQNSTLVCQYFCELIPYYSFKKIIFAVPQGKYDRNYENFKRYLEENNE